METDKLIDKLEENHVKYNQEVENYEENGEEDFCIWLTGEIGKYLRKRNRLDEYKAWKV